MHRVFFFLFFSVFTTSCSLLDPIVYKIPVQQGNILDKEQINKLKIGMSKEQVVFVLGTPMLTDVFNADHWEYLYILTLSNGSKVTKTLVVTYKNNSLSEFSGSYKDDLEKDAEDDGQ